MVGVKEILQLISDSVFLSFLTSLTSFSHPLCNPLSVLLHIECVCVWYAKNVLFIHYFLRLMCVFVGFTDFVKRGVLTHVDEIPRYRNYHY